MNTIEKRQSAYEKGRKKGETLVTRGQSTVADWRVYWHDSAESVARVIGWPVEKLTERVLTFHRERLDAVPDLTRYPELRGYRELLMEEERGMKNAGVDETLIALSKSLQFWRSTRLSEETGRSLYRQSLTERCRVLYLAESDRGALHLKNVDDPLTYWKPKPPIAQDSPWPLTHPLVFDGVGSGLHIDEIPPEIFPVDVQALCMEYCTTVPEAEQFMVHYNYFWGGQNLLVYDYHGNSVAFEKTSCRVVTHAPDSKGINFINGMSARDPEISAFHKQQRIKYLDEISADWNDSPDGCYFAFCENKGRNMECYVKELSANPTWDNAKQLLEQRDPSGPMCLTGEKSHPDQEVVGYTLEMRYYEVDSKRLHRRQWRGDVPTYLDTPEIVQFV